MEKREQLLNDIKALRDNWDERSCFKLKGVGNLSRSDLDTLELYADNNLNLRLMKPLGNIKKILDIYNIKWEG